VRRRWLRNEEHAFCSRCFRKALVEGHEAYLGMNAFLQAETARELDSVSRAQLVPREQASRPRDDFIAELDDAEPCEIVVEGVEHSVEIARGASSGTRTTRQRGGDLDG
jgi:hypothetical protein